MKVIDSTVQNPKDRKAGLLTDVQKKLGLSNPDLEAQESLIAVLRRVLDNRFVLLRDVALEGLDVPVPLVLVGPAGVHVLYASSAKGIYRAKEDAWEILDDHSRDFRPAHPNLVSRTYLMAQVVDMFLGDRQLPATETEPVLCFTDPGTHIDAVRPVVRVVMVDAIDRFASGLLQASPVLAPETVQKIAAALTANQPLAASDREQGSLRDAFSFQDEAEEKPRPKDKPAATKENHTAFWSKISFTPRQWVILGVFMVVDILILIAFILVVLFSA